ncbi:MAG: phytanoyl-CoA dioxygenase family protein [Gammaproteobacteria bacterium]
MSFKREGYLFVERLFSEEEIETLTASLFTPAMHQIPGVSREESSSAIRMTLGVHEHAVACERLTRHPRLIEPSEQIAGEPVYLYQSRVVMKSGMGQAFKPFPWHQDFSTWYLVDGMKEAKPIVIGVFLDEINACNAPLMIVPRSHRRGMIARSGSCPDPTGTGQIVIDAEILRKLVARGGMRALTGPPGSTFFIHANLVHASTENISLLRRAILYVVYNPMSNACTTRRAGYFAPNAHTPVTALADDCLLEAPRPPAV